MNDIIVQIIEVCLIPILGVLTKFAVDLLSAKRDEIKNRVSNEKAKKYIDMIYSTVTDCVYATEQTYVESLKAENAFTADAQKEALRRTLAAVQVVLNKDAMGYIEETTNDVTAYLTQLIEAEIKKNK